jgi:hypothetical protein
MRGALGFITHVILDLSRFIAISDKETATIKIFNPSQEKGQEKTLFWHRLHAHSMQLNVDEIRHEKSIAM